MSLHTLKLVYAPQFNVPVNTLTVTSQGYGALMILNVARPTIINNPETISLILLYLLLKSCHCFYLLYFELSNLKPVCDEYGRGELGIPIHFVIGVTNIYIFRNCSLLFSLFSDLFGKSFHSPSTL